MQKQNVPVSSEIEKSDGVVGIFPEELKVPEETAAPEPGEDDDSG